jgi:exo-beta-1,3-glucanase (GH17 family)
VAETDSPLPCPRAAPAAGTLQHPPAPGRGNALRWASALLIAALVAIINLLLWRVFNPPLAAPDVPSRVAGLAYNGFQRWQSPLTQSFPGDAALADDLQRLAGLTSRLRTYSASELPMLPALAAQAGLRLSAGVWLDSRRSNNEQEIAAIIEAVPRYPGIERVIAGNESQLRGVLSPTELYGYLDRLRAALPVPVSTAEPWHVWLRQPALVDHVDFITVHLLPYWEGLPVDMAVDYALQRLSEVRQRFPGKPVVIGEIGWPSHGDRVAAAEATPAAQARFVRAFLERASQLDVDYYLLEAVDQPWKRATEGAVGAHWGLLDAARQAKFAFTGPLQADPFWPGKALISSALGLLAIVPWLIVFSPMRLAGRVSFALSLQAVLSFAVLLATGATCGLPAAARYRAAGLAAAGIGDDRRDPVGAGLRIRRVVLAREPAPPGGAAPVAVRRNSPLRQHSSRLLQRAAGNGHRHHRPPAGTRLAGFRGTGGGQQYRRPGAVGTGAGARQRPYGGSAEGRTDDLLRPGPAFLPPAELAGLQGRRLERGARPARPARRVGGGGRRRLPGQALLAACARRPFRRPDGGRRAVAASPSRLGGQPPAPDDELGVRRLFSASACIIARSVTPRSSTAR